MAQGAFEGGVVSIRGDASQVKEELSEVSKLLTELEKNKVKLKPEIDINNVKKDINKLEQYMQGRFGALDFSKIYSSLMKTASRNPNDFVKQLERTMHGVNLLDQAVKPEDISKLAAASAEEMLELINGLGKLASSTKATGTPVTKRLQTLYEKYPNGIEGLGGSGKGGGFGASEETLNKIGETLERIDINVKSINDSIQTGAITVQAVAESAENVVDKTKQAADAQAELTRETEQTARAEEQLGQAQEKNNKQKKDNSNKKESYEKPKEEKTEKTEEPTKPKKPDKTKSSKEDVGTQKPDEKKITPTQSVNASSIKEAQQEQKKLGQATEETTKKLKEQQKIVQENGQKPDYKDPLLEQRKQNDKEFREKLNEIENQVKAGELSQSEGTIKKLDAKISWLEKYIPIEKASNKALEQSAQKWEDIRQDNYLNGSYEKTWGSIISHERQLQLAIDQRAKLLQEQSSELTAETKEIVEKPKEQKSDSQSETEMSTPDVKSIKDVVKAENELQNIAKETTNALKEQNKEINHQGQETLKNQNILEKNIENPNVQQPLDDNSQQDVVISSISNAANEASETLQKLSESQKELGDITQSTTEVLENQKQALTLKNTKNQNSIVNSDKKPTQRNLSFKDITKFIGMPDDIKDFVFDAEEAQSFLKKIQKKGKWVGQEKKIWAAFQSIRGLVGNEEIDDILDQFSDLEENFGYEDQVFNSPDQGSKMAKALDAYYDKYNRYKELLEKGNIEDLDLDTLRKFHQTNMEYKMEAMSPPETEQGYAQALDQMQKTLTVMEQYKKILDQAMAEGREISKYDQKFLLNYEKDHEQIERIAARAQTGKNRFEEARRIEAQKIAEKKREQEEEAKRREEENKAQKREEKKNRKNFIEKDNNFDKEFNENNIPTDLSSIDKQIIEVERNFGAIKTFKKDLENRENLEDYEQKWLEEYLNRYNKRVALIQKLKDKKKELETKQEENNKAIKDSDQFSSDKIVDQTQKDVEKSQENAKKAEDAAEKAKQAVSESEEAVKKTEEVKKKAEKESVQKEDKKPIAESINTNQTVQKNVKYVTRTKEQLQAQLTMAEQSVVNYKEKQEQLQKEIESIQNKTFDVNGQEWGNAKTAEEFLANKLIEDNAELEKVNTNLTKKENSVKNLSGRIKQIESWEEQGFDIQIKGNSSKPSAKKKIAIGGAISGKTTQASSSDTINIQIEEEKKDGEAVSKLKDETQNTNNKLQETKELTDEQNQLLDALFNGDNKKGSSGNNGLGNENNSFTSLIESLKNLPAITEILSEFDAVNSNISKNAQGAANAIQAEANAFSSMTQATQGVNSKQLITSDKRDTGLLEIESTGNELKEIEQKKDQYKKIIDQIKIIEDGRIQAEEEIARYSTSDKNFKVGRSKNKAYDLIKTYAEQLKQDYEAYEKLDPNDTSNKAKEIIAKYENSRVAFSKAISKMVANGLPKDKGDESVGFWELSNKHGVGSEGFDEAEKHVADNLKFLEERLNQQKQQAEIVLNKLYAERDRLQQELTSPSSQVNVLANGNNLPVDKPDLGGGQSANGIRTEGDEAGNAVANMQALAQAKKEVTEANQKLSQSAQETANSLNGEAGAGTNTSEAFDPKPLQQEIDALKQVSEQQKKTIDEQKQAIDELQKKQEQATNEKIANLQKENEALTAQQRKELEQRRQAELNAQVMANLQKKQFEEDEKIHKEQEAKAAQKAEERAKKAEENARIKTEDKDFSKLYTEYGKDYSAILDAKSVQEFDMAVAHLTETERQFWEARMLQAGGSAYAHQADMLKQNDLPEGYEKSVDNQTAILKQREMAIAEYTANVIAELEKQEAAFEKMDTVYKTATDNPNHARKDFIDSSLVDRNQTQKYTYAIDDVTKSLQRMREIIQSMKDGTFDFGNIDALRELLELRQNLSNQMSTAKDADKAYKKAQGDIEADSVKQVEQYKTVLNGLQKQIEGIQKDSKKLINPDNDYKSRLTEAKTLLETIQNIINNLNNNPLQFIGEDGQRNARNTQAFIDESKQLVDEFQEDYNSQKGIQGRINTYFTSYKGAYTSFFREIKDSFKSQALGELQNEIDRTFKTFEDSITNLNRATGLNQGEFLDKYLNTNGGKATASQIEQQQKVKNAIAENYRGLITDMSNELSKVQDRMSNIFGENFLKGDFLANFRDNFTAGLGDADEFSKFQNNAQKAKDSFIELQKIQKQMADGKLDLTQLAPDQLKDKIQEIVKLFADLNENYKKVTDNAKDFTFADMGDIEKQRAGITQFLKSNRGISSEARAYLQDYFNQLQQGISQADLTKLTDGWHQVADAEQAAGRTGATFMSELQTRFRSLSAYLLSFVSFYRVIGVFKDGINIIHELDDALTEMNKVSTESLASLKDYQKESFGVANDVGTTATQLQQSTADFVRLGESFQEAKESARVANELLTVSEFDNIQDATTALTAISAAYEDTANGLDKQAIIDKLNKIGDEYAISTDGLATALQDSASALTTANNDMDEAAALLAAGNTVTQDPSKTGKAMRTVALRLVGMKCA